MMDEFWKNNGDKIQVGVITAIIVLFLSEPIKALFKKIGNWIEKIHHSLGFGFQKRYYHALIEGHKWLKLRSIYNPSDLQSPRLPSRSILPTVIRWDLALMRSRSTQAWREIEILR
ncbi:MAG TPA: hypothetical protein VMJ90_02060 [Anaerolineales bacterium]|nr:hypothetical protein [Anaerolineales bacterium]